MKDKTYISGETKADRKARKRKEKASKYQNANGGAPLDESITLVSAPGDLPINPAQKSIITPPVTRVVRPNDNFVVCLKYGNKYDATYVNKLYDMVTRNLTIDHQFVCFTEDTEGLYPEIRVEQLPQAPLSGWWYKPYFFAPSMPLVGTVLFLDLDMIIFRNIDHLFTHDPNKFYIIRDFNRHVIPGYQKFNSSIFRVNTGQHSEVWTNFISNSDSIIRRYHGDQDWIRVAITQNYCFWPDEWIQSYKWEMRQKAPLNKGPRGKRDFAKNGDPIIKDETSVAVFHGDPNPHNCKDQWVIDNWK